MREGVSSSSSSSSSSSNSCSSRRRNFKYASKRKEECARLLAINCSFFIFSL